MKSRSQEFTDYPDSHYLEAGMDQAPQDIVARHRIGRDIEIIQSADRELPAADFATASDILDSRNAAARRVQSYLGPVEQTDSKVSLRHRIANAAGRVIGNNTSNH